MKCLKGKNIKENVVLLLMRQLSTRDQITHKLTALGQSMH